MDYDKCQYTEHHMFNTLSTYATAEDCVGLTR